MNILTNKYGVKYIEPNEKEIPEGHTEITVARIATKEIPDIGKCNIEIPTSYNKDKESNNPYVKILNTEKNVDMLILIESDNISILGMDKDYLLSKWNFWNSEIIEALEEEENG